ncbi:abhydrolase domain-containing protein [Histoplasma capsulatum]|uniref:Abhydrolase domain-containing protein n=1 Tax=Ajellomyces capsulatus TaxID=5037 RepID=A0A8A1MNA0_AJECA|nr:conserved hypothetical protein [Histoplasma mississippiense (nom. inval.)]EDN10205.1 conserved hypothetical protein [Histoplasma mississippiense (nom. inval.)]QSS66102.1 abhydrolase domain-containing protein [Histoplasma capsulatum]
MATATSTASGSSEDLGAAFKTPEPPQGKLPDRITGRLFPLSYKEGFSQWWASIPAATAEHKVLSFIPYLQHPPTHKQTGKDAVTPNQSTDSLTEADPSQAFQISTKSVDDPHGPRIWRSTMVELSGKNRALNEFSIERVGEKTEQNLVILHGYGAGLGFFYKNFDALSRAKGWHLYALDMLGMGRSTRPPFKIHSKERQKAISEAEDWFIDALEEWRIKRRLDKFTLLGHSLGGYIAVSYALKYPGRLNKLILASPVGIPEDPFAVSAEMPEPSASTVANESGQGQKSITKPAPDNNNNNNNGVSSEATPPRRPLPKWVKYLWDSNVSPFSLVRWSGPLGPRLISAWTSRRFSHLPPAESQALHDYAYSLFRMRGSGEYALAYILAPGAFARNPLIRRIHAVGRQVLRPDDVDIDVNAAAAQAQTETQTQTQKWCAGKQDVTTSTPPPETSLNSTTDAPTPAPQSSSASSSTSTSTPTSQPSPPRREQGIPIVLMYGEHDWMDVAGGYAAKARIEEEKARILRDASPEERAADQGSAKVVIIKNAGHHLYLDGWEEFNEVMLEEMRGVHRAGKAEGRGQNGE